MKKQEYNARRNEQRRRQNRKVLPSFPWKGTFQTKDEIDTYFAGDKIQCLLCGKWYQKLSGPHLTHIHNMTDDEYRECFGLPWGRGLTSERLHKKRSDITKRQIAAGQLPVFDGRDEQMRQKAQASPRKPTQPFAQDIRRQQVRAIARKRRAQTTIEDMRQLAARRGGKCLSAAYITDKTKLLWQCAEGHQWEAKPTRIKHGTWCPTCARRKQAETFRLGIEAMQQLAASRGGKCLSTTYINMETKLLWQCAEGHQWEAIAINIKQGHWCPICAGNAQRTIKEMQHIARERGGKCLSESYSNNKTKLIWQCAEGHQWEAIPKNVNRGSWCPTCARLKWRK